MSDKSLSSKQWVPDPGVEHHVFETPWLNFFYDDIVHPDGRPGKYAWVRSHSGNGAVMTIPVTPSEKYLMIKVYRHPSKRFLWEFPAGLMEQGETPIEAGQRELLEETGLVPNKMTMLGTQTPVAGYVGDYFHSLVAAIPEISIDDVTVQGEEGIVDARLFSRSELIEFLNQEEVGDGVTLTCLARYWMWQELNTKTEKHERSYETPTGWRTEGLRHSMARFLLR
ncbi:NUDIX hydrolase [Dehalococcoides mccartyi]|nr:NUDIX hydrolase [Dehalococcoides mccartyi]